MKIFNAVEIWKILRGDNSKFKLEDWEKYIEVLHGYQKDIPQIKMLSKKGGNAEEEQHLLTKLKTINLLPVIHNWQLEVWLLLDLN